MFSFGNLKIKNKIILVILVVSTLTSIIGYSIILQVVMRILENNIRDNALAHAELIAEYVAVQMTFELDDNAYETLTKIKQLDNIVAGVIYKNDGTIFTKYIESNTHFKEPTEIPKKTIAIDDGEYINAYCRVIYDGNVLGTLQLVVTKKAMSDTVHVITRNIIIVLILMLILTMIFAYFFQKPISKPILRLTEATRSITKNSNYSMRMLKTSFDEIGDLYDAFNSLIEATQTRENERDKAMQSMSSQNDVLTQTLDELKKAQDQIIESEKMAALGQLVAVVAHEVNTPLGAIHSSISIIRDNLKQLMTLMPKNYSTLPQEYMNEYHHIVEIAMNNSESISTMEERKIRRRLMAILEDADIERADEYAEMLVEMGVKDNIEEIIPILKSEYCDQVLQLAYKVGGLFTNASNIDVATGKASDLVKSLKTYTYLSNQHEMSDFDLTDNIETILVIYHNMIKRGVKVTKNYEISPIFKCNPDEMNQVWTNLIHNAIQAMNYSGELTIDILDKGENFVVRIADTGCGIPQEKLAKIFEAFYTTKPKGEGTGLGLYIVKRIIEKHNGKIDVKSSEKGTTFSITLPKTSK